MITATIIENAIEIGRYAISHAAVALADAGGRSDLGGARTICAWLKRNGRSEVSRREIHQALRGYFPRSEDIATPLQILEERGYLRPIVEGEHLGRPSPRYAVHPQLAARWDF